VEFVRKHFLHLTFCALLLACVFVWTNVYAGERGGGVLTLAMLDIGQGDALYIEGPTGIQILVDAGPNSGAILRELAEVMPLGDRTLDAAIETHPDAYHIGGFVDVLERYSVGSYISPGIVKENTLTAAVSKKLEEQNVPVYVARQGMVVDLGGGAYLSVLYPDTDVGGWGNKANDGSIVAQLVYGQARALLTGDIGAAGEHRLLAAGDLRSDVLKVGHHGSKTSTTDAFVAAVNPRLALVSVGAKNSYGHPTQEVLARLESAGALVVRTDQKGTVTCVSDGALFTCE